MDSTGIRRWGTIALICLGGGLCGCSHSDPQRLYLLRAALADTSSDTGAAPTLVIGVGPVSIPRYLDRDEMIRRTTPSRLEIDEFDRWAEPLATACQNAVVGNLEALFPNAQVYSWPWPADRHVARRVTITILNFEAGPDAAVGLRARWTIADAGDKTPKVRTTQVSQAIADPGDMEAVVAAHSEALATLCRRIGDVLRPVP